MGPRGADELPLARYPAARCWAMSFSLTEETIHLPWPPDRDMIECFLEMEKMGTWALELEIGRVKIERRREERKGKSLSPYKGSRY